jgi:DNA polymerase-3 subunit gamma/tau
MDYEPLHHKYRPQTFKQLVGQGAIATTLSNALHQQRIAPAYLFCGPRGTGKTSSARILAKSLNCLNSSDPTPDPCGHCQVCQEIATGIALDIVEIDAASNTGVDNIRELIERAQFAPVQCRYKVYVIDECHMLSTAAFNALLKTLEEPPNHVVFVLATTDPQRVLPTIISRCQRFDFRRIPLDEMVQHLTHIAQQESIQIQADAIQLVAQISQGGLRDAESLLDQLSLLEGKVTVEAVWELVGAVPERDLLSLIKAITADDGPHLLDQVRHLMDRGREPLIVLQSLVAFYRDLLIAKTASTRQDLVAVTPPTWTEMCEFAQQLPVPMLLASQQHLRTAEVQVKHTTQPRLWLEITLMGLLPSALGAITPTVSSAPSAPTAPKVSSPAPPASPAHSTHSAPPDSPPPATSSIVSAPVEPPSASPAPPSPSSSPPSPAFGSMNDIWANIIANLTPYGTQALMKQQGELLCFDGVEAQVGIRSQKLMRMAQDRLPNIEAAFEKVFGHSIRVSLEVSGSEDLTVEDSPSSSNLSSSNPPPAATKTPPSTPPPIQRNGSTPTAAANSSPVGGSSDVDASSANLLPLLPIEDTEGTGLAQMTGRSGNWEIESEFERNVKSFAQFFNGQIINLDDDEASDKPQQQSRQPKSSQPGPDVPF